VSDTQARLDARDALQRAIRHTRKRFSAGTPEKYPGTPLYGLRLSEAEALAAELERVTAENDRLRAALSSALANEAQWWKKAQAALSPTYGPVGSLDGKGGVGW
jgi:hypothetical protein